MRVAPAAQDSSCSWPQLYDSDHQMVGVVESYYSFRTMVGVIDPDHSDHRMIGVLQLAAAV